MWDRHNTAVISRSFRFERLYSLEFLETRWMMEISQVATFTPPGNHTSGIQHLGQLGNNYYLMANGNGLGRELWKIDLSSLQASIVKDITPGPQGFDPDDHTFVGFADSGFFYFNHRAGLYRTDGTADGTVRLSTTSPGEFVPFRNGYLLIQDTRLYWTSSPEAPRTNIASLVLRTKVVVHDGIGYFSAAPFLSADRELWRTDGTAVGTYRLKDLRPGPEGSYPEKMASVNGKLLFFAQSQTSTSVPWTSDGTAEGTLPIPLTSPLDGSHGTTVSNDQAYFATSYGAWRGELLVTDGTALGTRLVKDQIPGPEGGSSVSSVTDLNGSVIFGNDDPQSEAYDSIYVTDGTELGTIRLLNSGIDTHVFDNTLPRIGQSVFFAALTWPSSSALYATDGTVASTRRLFSSATMGGTNGTTQFFTAGNNLFFTAGGMYGSTLYVLTDADTQGPSLVNPAFDVTRAATPISFRFSERVGDSFAASDLELRDADSNTVVLGAIAEAPMRSGNSSVEVRFTGPGGFLTDGNYQLRLPAGSVTDEVSNPLSDDFTFDFFILAGDANRDRAVNISDFAILAARFNLPGTFSQGDFNYDGVTNISDFAILASKFNTTLPAPSDLPSSRTSAPSRTAPLWNDRRVIELVEESTV